MAKQTKTPEKKAAKPAAPKLLKSDEKEIKEAAKKLVKESTEKNKEEICVLIHDGSPTTFEPVFGVIDPAKVILVALKATDAGLGKILKALEIFKPATSRNDLSYYKSVAKENAGYTIITTQLFLDLFVMPHMAELKQLYNSVDDNDLDHAREVISKMESYVTPYMDKNILVHYY